MISLSNSTLACLPEPVKRPSYDRSKLSPGIVHIGLGNFHRVHQSWYLHRLMQQGQAHNWAIIGAGVRPYDCEMRAKLRAQDYLTTLIELSPEGTSAEVTGSMIGYVPVADGNRPLIEQMAAAEIRIVSLTVTEGGYYIDPATKGFDADHPDIRHDAINPETPRTAFGAIVAALKLRRANGVGPFTVQSCDNLQGNGDILRQTVVSLARLSEPGLADWIDANCTFPNSMVDCIVPATGPKEIELARTMGIDDAAPVTHENFRQWVIEDAFCAGRPQWDQVGGQLSTSVDEFEAQKIRILNGGHQVIANVAEVLGVVSVSQAMRHSLIFDLFLKVEMEEIVPHVASVPGMTPDAYVRLIERRFSNPGIVDTIRRIAFDGSSRHPGMIVPTIRDGLAANASVDGLALVEAAWARMCLGTRDDGSAIEPNDPFWDTRKAAARAARNEPVRWLEQRDLYGDLANVAHFAEKFARWLNIMHRDGMETALQVYLKGT